VEVAPTGGPEMAPPPRERPSFTLPARSFPAPGHRPLVAAARDGGLSPAQTRHERFAVVKFSSRSKLPWPFTGSVISGRDGARLPFGARPCPRERPRMG